MSITDILKEHFIEIVSKHNNPTWARQELEWLVYCQYKHASVLATAAGAPT